MDDSHPKFKDKQAGNKRASLSLETQMTPKSRRSTNPKMVRINLLMPHGHCYKWLSPSPTTKMHINRFAFIFLATASLVVLAMPVEARNYYVRETQGTVEIRGWEKGIIKKNPNLKRWHWMPITASYNHCKPIVPSKKPWTVDRVLRKAPVDRIVHNPHYIRPRHATLPTARNHDGSMRRNPRVSNPLVTHDVDGQMRARDVAAKLQMQRTQAQLATRDVDAGLSMPVVRGNYRLAKHEVAGYLSHKKTDIKLASHDLTGQLSNRAVAGQLGNRAVAGHLASRSVDGRLISENVTGNLESTTVSADLMTPITRSYDFNYRGPNEGFDDTPTFVSGYQSVRSGVSAKLANKKRSKF